MWSSITHTNVELTIVINVIEIRDSFKRIINNVNLSESEEYVHRLKKTQRTNQYADINLYEYVW